MGDILNQARKNAEKLDVKMQKNLNKTISQLLHHEWVGPTPTHDDSFIQQNLYRLYHTIVADLDIEDVRFLINQEICSMI